MFGILRKKLKESVHRLAEIAGRDEGEEPEAAQPAKKPAKAGKKRPTAKTAEEKKISKISKGKEPPQAKVFETVDLPPEPEPQEPEVPETTAVPMAPAEPMPETGLKPEVEPGPEPEPAPRPGPEEKKGGRFGGLFKRVREKQFSEPEIDQFFDSVETDLLQANLALQVMDFLRSRIKENLVGKPVKRSEAETVIAESFKSLLLEIVDQKRLDMTDAIRNAKNEKRPACFLFLGYNGSGKTTSIAKVATLLMKNKHKPVLAAADTFRAASIEQLEFHGGKLGLTVIKHKYGSDPAAVVFDARKHAESKGLDVVLADTAGRMHTNVNLMDELKKVTRVNSPDMKILVVDSLTGNDVVPQVMQFNHEIGIDGLILTKMDVNEKGGSIISACYTAKKPVLFIGTGQGYEDLEEFDPAKFVQQILG